MPKKLKISGSEVVNIGPKIGPFWFKSGQFLSNEQYVDQKMVKKLSIVVK